MKEPMQVNDLPTKMVSFHSDVELPKGSKGYDHKLWPVFASLFAKVKAYSFWIPQVQTDPRVKDFGHLPSG